MSAIVPISAGLSIATELLRQYIAVSMLIAEAKREQRDIDQGELDAIFKRDDAARIDLVDAIKNANPTGDER